MTLPEGKCCKNCNWSIFDPRTYRGFVCRQRPVEGICRPTGHSRECDCPGCIQSYKAVGPDQYCVGYRPKEDADGTS